MTPLLRRSSLVLRAAILCLGLAPTALVAQLNENFDGVAPPNLPPGWTANNANELLWQTTAFGPDSPPNSVIIGSGGQRADRRLVSLPITVSSTAAQLIFESHYITATGNAGGVLEISFGGGPFQDIEAAGGVFNTFDGYSGPITSTDNPLFPRMAWMGDSDGFTSTAVTLPASANGQTIRFRWRWGSGSAGGGGFWQIDTLTMTGASFTAEDFDNVNPPALPAQWSADNAEFWVTSAAAPASPPNDAFTDNPIEVADRRLDSPAFAIPAGIQAAVLSFENNYDLEAFPPDFFDGGVLEISIGGGAFQDIEAAGGVILAGPYVGALFVGDGNPLGGRNAWSGNSGGYVTTRVQLPAAAIGQTVQLRWRLGTGDETSPSATQSPDVPGLGWRIDSITLELCPPTAVASAANPIICSNSSTTLTGSGGDTCAWTPATWLSNPASCTPTVVPNGEAGTILYTLTVTKAACVPTPSTDTATVSVTSQPVPIAVASATRTAICPGGSTQLLGSGGDTCMWTPATGLANPLSCSTSATPTATRTYSLTVTSAACGTSTNAAQVTIVVTDRPPGPEVSAPAVVSEGDMGLVASIVDPNPGSIYNWFFTPADAATVVMKGLSSITFNANKEGPLLLSVTEKDGACISEETEVPLAVGPPCLDPQPPTELAIRVAGNPDPDAPVFGIDVLDLSWTAPESPPRFFLWSLNGNPEQQAFDTVVPNVPPTGSNDPITLQVRSACSEELVSEPEEVTKSPTAPVASFSVGDGPVEVATPIVFTDTSSPAATAWLWLFGDGSDPETTQSVTHSFAEGTYTVFMIASNGAGSSAASRVFDVSPVPLPSPLLAKDTRAFDAGARGRRRLNAVSLAGRRPAWLHVRSDEATREAVAFLRFLDASGTLVLERRLSVSPGQEAVFDLSAYGLDGTYDLELVSFRALSASVVDTRTRSTREVRRPQR